MQTSAGQRRAAPGAVVAGACGSTPSRHTKGARLGAGSAMPGHGTRSIAVGGSRIRSAVIRSCKETQKDTLLVMTTSKRRK
jgi:hypothetical protein